MEREQTTIRLPTELKQRIQQEAETHGYSLKDTLIFILSDYFLFAGKSSAH